MPEALFYVLVTGFLLGMVVVCDLAASGRFDKFLNN